MGDIKHHWPPKQCYHCGKPATCYCDGVNHFLVDSKMKILTADPNVVEWCDRPLCEDHAVTAGMSTASGSVDTVDYCSKHETMRKLGDSPKLKVEPNSQSPGLHVAGNL